MKKRIIYSVCGVLAAAIVAVVIYFCIPKKSASKEECYFTVSSSVSVEVGKTVELTFAVTPDKSAISFNNKSPQIFSAQIISNKIVFKGLNVGSGIFELCGRYKNQEFSAEIIVTVNGASDNQNPDTSNPTDPANPETPIEPSDPTTPTSPDDSNDDENTYPTTEAIKFKNPYMCRFVNNQFLIDGEGSFVTLSTDLQIESLRAYKLLGDSSEELSCDNHILFLPYENFMLKIVTVTMDGATYENFYQVMVC